jgi:hypothetical protein
MVSPHAGRDGVRSSVFGQVSMIRKLIRIVLWAAVVGGAVAAVLKARAARRGPLAAGSGATEPWPRLDVDEPGPAPVPAAGPSAAAPQPAEAAPKPAAAESAAKPAAAKAAKKPAAKPAKAAKSASKASAAPPADGSWVAPVGGVCPTTHPVKASLARRIFHVPGGASYGRVTPERCYRSPEDAERDGLRQAGR